MLRFRAGRFCLAVRRGVSVNSTATTTVVAFLLIVYEVLLLYLEIIAPSSVLLRLIVLSYPVR